MNKTLVILPSIRILQHWNTYEKNAEEHNFNLDNIEVLVIDETDKNREENSKILKNVKHHFYGELERQKWFKDLNLTEYIDIIPKNSHAETSFGLLWAYKENRFDQIIFMDDDTRALGCDYFSEHIKQLSLENADVTTYYGKWYNLIGRFFQSPKFARGFPYSMRNEYGYGNINNSKVDVVMNQGMWSGQLDLNAIDILPNMNGLDIPMNTPVRTDNIILDKGTYTTICSMNLSFKPEIVPAFYQFSTNRFDDIWSGVIIKKIADHLNKQISHGSPFCGHVKEPRSTFKDIEIESKELGVNEYFWEIVDKVNLKSDNWLDCYREISESIHRNDNYILKDYGSKIIKWCDCIGELDELRKS